MFSLTPLQRWVATIVALVLSGASQLLPIPVQFKSIIGFALTLFAALGIVPPQIQTTATGKIKH